MTAIVIVIVVVVIALVAWLAHWASVRRRVEHARARERLSTEASGHRQQLEANAARAPARPRRATTSVPPRPRIG